MFNKNYIKEFILKFKSNQFNKFLVYSDNLFLLEEFKIIIKRIAFKIKYKKIFYFINNDFLKKKQNFDYIYNEKKLFIFFLYDNNVINTINNIIKIKKKKIKILIIVLKLKYYIEKSSWFKNILKIIIYLKFSNIKIFNIKKFIEKKIKIKITLLKFEENLLNLVYTKNINNLILLKQKIKKINILKKYDKYYKIKNFKELLFNYKLYDIIYLILKMDIKNLSIILFLYRIKNQNINIVINIIINLINNCLKKKLFNIKNYKSLLNKILLNLFILDKQIKKQYKCKFYEKIYWEKLLFLCIYIIKIFKSLKFY